MSHILVRPATHADAVWIGARLRPEDAREVRTMSGLGPETAVPKAYAASTSCFTARCVDASSGSIAPGRPDADPCVIFGVTDDPREPTVGCIWLLATPEIRRCSKAVLQESPYWLAAFLRRYPGGLHNWVDSRNPLHIRWCRRVGFRFGRVMHHRGAAFHHAFFGVE